MKINLNFLNKIYLLLVLALSISYAGIAQRDVYNWQVAPYAGLLTLNNDITLPQSTNFFTYGFRLDRRLGDAFTLGLNFSYIHPDNTSQDDIAGSFIGVTYHWDNGYLFSKRSTVSIFNRLEAGYTDKTSRIKNLESTGGDLTFGFENGVKFRFGDRFSADLSLEILASKQSIIEGVFIDNLRYNVWKVGVSYHFGSRKSNFVPPVFVPSGFVLSNSNVYKIESKEDSLWTVDRAGVTLPDTLEQEVVPESLPAQSMHASVSRADSLAIFMHFDSLYQRRVSSDTALTLIDSSFSKSAEFSPDSSYFASDSIDGKGATQQTLADTIPQISETASVQQPDTISETFRSQQEAARMDTINTVHKTEAGKIDSTGVAAEKAETTSQKLPERADEKAAESGRLTNDQADQIAQNQKDIEKLSSEQNRSSTNNGGNKNGGLGTAIAAGAAGAAVGALVSKDKKQKPDTVFYVSAATQAKIDSLQREINLLKQKLAGGVVAEKNTVVTPPVGLYYAADTSRTDSVGTDSLRTDSLLADTLRLDSVLVDSTYADSTHSDSLRTMPDTLSILTVNSEIIDSLSSQLPDSTAIEYFITDSLAADSILHEDEQADLIRADTIADNSLKPLLATYPVSCNFSLNSTVIQTADTVQLNQVVLDLKQDFDRKVVLIGHTDKSGNPDYNLHLSKRRAGSVRDYLVSKGIDSTRIAIESRGAEDAVEQYNMDSRRVDIHIIEKE